jgi:hypothetical protein
LTNGHANLTALETALEQFNAKAMADAFKDESAFSMPETLTAEGFESLSSH